MRSKIITISLPRETIEKGKILAKNNGATFSGLIRIGLERQLKDEGIE